MLISPESHSGVLSTTSLPFMGEELRSIGCPEWTFIEQLLGVGFFMLFLKNPSRCTFPYSSRVKDQGRTKDEPRMNLRTPNHKMCILLRLPSLLPCIYLTSFHRENSDRRPSEERHNSLPTTSAVS